MNAAARTRGRSRGLRRLSWGLADQALSSLTNFALSLLVIRSTTLRGFGAFGLAFATYSAALGLSRAFSSQPLMVRFTGDPDARWRRAVGGSTGFALVTGSLTGAAIALGGAFLGDPVGPVLIALGVSIPGLLLQDAWRWVFFSTHRGRLALLNDLAWAAVMFGALGLVLIGRDPDVADLTLAWGASASVAAILGGIQARALPRVRLVREWWVTQRDLGPRFAGEFAATNGSTQLGVYAVAAMGGLQVVGAIRAAQTLFGPYNVFSMGLGMVAIPQSVSSLKQSLGKLRSTVRMIATTLGGSALLWGAIALVVPDRWGTALMGSTWGAAQRVLVAVTVMRAAVGVITGLVTGFRALEAARRSFWVRLVTSPFTIIGGGIGAATGSAAAAAWGLAIGTLVAMVVWIAQLRVAYRDYQASPERATTEAALGS